MSQDEKEHIVSIVGNIEVKDNETKLYKSCCFEIDRKATIFFTTLSLSLLTITFCIFKLTQQNLSCSEQNSYMSLMTFILGIYMRSPLF